MLSQTIIESICDGAYPDCHSILGMHYEKSIKGMVIRAFIPYADSVALEYKNENRVTLKPLKKLHKKGFYQLNFPNGNHTFTYRFVIHHHDGSIEKIDDPYRFSSLLNNDDLHLWAQGKHHKSYLFMGSHIKKVDNVEGVHFVVTAPTAKRVSVIGDFNHWDGRIHVMRKLHEYGLWEIFIPNITKGMAYKYEIISDYNPSPIKKMDPYAFYNETHPPSASYIYDMDNYIWNDEKWLNNRKNKARYDKPLLIYEVHLGSWQRNPQHPEKNLSYREIAHKLIPYVKKLNFTHIELMPITEYPYYGSWGYQTTGYYAPTGRYGKPEGLKYFIDYAHKNNIGIILDWVPAHFATDEFGLFKFDGTSLYEHQDERQGIHKDWGTAIFNYERYEVLNFLISSAMFWCQEYHIDGIRVDAVASMLYLDYSRKENEWIPNYYGGRENLGAIHFFQSLNTSLHQQLPGILTFAEESTAWDGVTKDVQYGGLGFDYKWNMGWMNDSLEYIKHEPIHRKYHHNALTFSLLYAYSERFCLPISHDEVVHGKGSLLNKMPGDNWQKLANARLYFAYMYAHPGKKLIFMGAEFGQWNEWNVNHSLDWHLIEHKPHYQLQQCIKDLNKLYIKHPPFWERDDSSSGFTWIDFQDVDQSIISFTRNDAQSRSVLCIFNFTPIPRYHYRIGVEHKGRYKIIFNSDSSFYGGANMGVTECMAEDIPSHNKQYSISLILPPLAGLYIIYIK